MNALSGGLCMTSQVGVLGAESYLILSCNYQSPLLLKVLSDKQALVDRPLLTNQNERKALFTCVVYANK